MKTDIFAAISFGVLILVVVLAITIMASGRFDPRSTAPVITVDSVTGEQFIPADSGLGPLRRDVREFVLNNGKICRTVWDEDHHTLLGLKCK
jgi:hypothetical protein